MLLIIYKSEKCHKSKRLEEGKEGLEGEAIEVGKPSFSRSTTISKVAII